MSWPQIRERINLYLFENKERNLGILKFLNVIVTLGALGTLVWMYGFSLGEAQEDLAFLIIKTSFTFYVFQYLVKVIYDFQPRDFIRRTWFEGAMMGILIAEGISYSFTDELIITKLFGRLGVDSAIGISTLFIQVYFLLVVIAEFIRNSDLLPKVRLNPAVIFILSFLCIILTGTLLLTLPEMTVKGSLPLTDALFTATSASCVTGLMTIEVSTVFTFKGQLIILLLIKLGSLNIIAFGGFLALMGKFGVGVRHHRVIEGFVNRDNILSAKGMLGKVIMWTFAFEILGAIGLWYLWEPSLEWSSQGERIFSSIFHSVSAFNNAGISIFENGLANEALRFNYLAHWVIICLVFFGSLGILSVFDLFSIKRLRDRLRHPWKQIQFSTKIALYISVLLIVAGAISIFLLERNGSLAGKSLFGQITGSVFHSVARTSGFATLDVKLFDIPTIVILIALMYIGASSGSTGGGIKTSSLAVIFADLRSAMTGRERTVLWKRTLNSSLKSKAYSIAIIYVVMIFLGVILLSISESHLLGTSGWSFIDLAFEQVSAFCTVGLSRGVTPLLSEPGKLIVIASMFIGRVGTFTIAFALAGHFVKQRFKYPEADMMVG